VTQLTVLQSPDRDFPGWYGYGLGLMVCGCFPCHYGLGLLHWLERYLVPSLLQLCKRLPNIPCLLSVLPSELLPNRHVLKIELNWLPCRDS
jgi:hypothetical protein